MEHLLKQPHHHKAGFFANQGFFAGLASFHELEKKIAALPTTKDRGDAFEVFAEAYLATQPIVQAQDVWPFDAVPLHIKQQHFLDTCTDMGVDGVFETRSGQFSAYQVKFRTSRPALTWAELSTFMGLTDYVGERVLFTNCDDLPGLMNERSGFFCIRGTDLDRLEPADFEAIAAWLAGAPVAKKKKDPLPHQVKALSKILDAFSAHDRATTVMACGSGKTLLALWVAERMGVKTILVLVPALALLRQTLHQWLSQTRWDNIAYLCVCSDPTVEKNTDELIVRQSDLDFPVTTDSRTVKKFLEHTFDGVKIVFSTYHSARVVAEGMDTSTPFELGLFDEAHKTSGREGAGFAFALRDANLPIQKRLFLTATPRHYDVKQKDKEGDSKLVYSMDVPEVYGPVASKLSFAEAVRLDIICDYKVIISVVTSEMVNNALLSKGEVLINGDAVQARQVANQLALQMAVEKHGVSKIFTFHRSVASAQSFTRQGSEGITAHLSDFAAFHVNGEMPTARREEFMTAFRDAPKALMSNARCLTEGVDVPAVDMVAFMSPKRSRVDIVQAAGRAMRKKDGKACGYIFIPLFVEQAQGETLEQALARAEFEEVWDVLQAMQEQDDVLADIISQMRQEYGKRKGYDDFRFRGKVEVLGQELSLNILRESITTRCIERLGTTWDERYGELKAFKERFNHCNVPQGWQGNPKLGKWISTQRSARKTHQLSVYRIQRLDEIGFVWDSMDAVWEEMFELLKEYKQKYGHCNVPQRWTENAKLGKWVNTQRKLRRKNQLSADRIQRFNEIGFVWDPMDAVWEEMLELLKEYKQQYGNSNVPNAWPENSKLGAWVIRQRQSRKKNKLSADHTQRLNEMGFVWEHWGTVWEKMFELLNEYKQQYGNSNVPRGWLENQKLSSWVNNQRRSIKKNKLSAERIQQLDEIGFVVDPFDAVWEEMFELLKNYKQHYGHCNVPDKYPEKPQLGTWVGTQRKSKKNNQLSADRTRRLNEIGFVWDSLDAVWKEMFELLKDYKQHYGHCNGPQGWPENSKMGRWISTQRQSRKNNQLSTERAQRINEIGFVWDPLDAVWEEMFELLKGYKQQYGNCNVPQGWPKNPKLGKWVNTQRKSRRLNQLSAEHIQHLVEIDFVWDPLDAVWEEMFELLKGYKQQYGNCNVPQGWPENQKLATWVNTQRQSIKKNKLSAERIQRLDEIGFVCDPFDAAWEEIFELLKNYKQQYGHCNVPYAWPKNPQLSIWVSNQRKSRRLNQLSSERTRRLNEMGFLWDPFDAMWEEMFQVLKDYKQQHGHCNAPQRWLENQKLGTWVGTQRKSKKNHQLSTERIQRLNEMGFVWNSLDAAWEEMFQVLKDYKQQYDHCNVPARWPENPMLSRWVISQRHSKKSNKLSPDRIQRLEEIGFKW